MIEINSKEDIIIPFHNIGEPNWERNTRLIIESIVDNWGDELKDPISMEELEILESRLGTTLPTGLKVFYEYFGIANIGEELQDLKNIDWLKNSYDYHLLGELDYTEEERRLLPYLITFSDYLGNGNMFCFHGKTKEIYYLDHDHKPYLSKMFDTVDDYLRGCLIFAQVDLFGEAKQEDVEIWTEEIVCGFVDRERVKKWRY